MKTPIYDRIMDVLQASGYDFITANGLAKDKIQELNGSPKGRYTFKAGKEMIVVDRA